MNGTTESVEANGLIRIYRKVEVETLTSCSSGYPRSFYRHRSNCALEPLVPSLFVSALVPCSFHVFHVACLQGDTSWKCGNELGDGDIFPCDGDAENEVSCVVRSRVIALLVYFDNKLWASSIPFCLLLSIIIRLFRVDIIDDDDSSVGVVVGCFVGSRVSVTRVVQATWNLVLIKRLPDRTAALSLSPSQKLAVWILPLAPLLHDNVCTAELETFSSFQWC